MNNLPHSDQTTAQQLTDPSKLSIREVLEQLYRDGLTGHASNSLFASIALDEAEAALTAYFSSVVRELIPESPAGYDAVWSEWTDKFEAKAREKGLL